MNRIDIVNSYIQKYNYTSYLEIGVDTKTMFNSILNTKTKECIDPNPKSKATYQMTSDKFFEDHPEKKYDIIFIDGLHHSDTVDRDIQNSIKALNPNGTILLHDCNPSTELHQRVPMQSGHWNGDVWKSIVKFIHHSHSDYEIFTVDTDEGIGVIRKGNCECNFELPEMLTWDWLVENRKSALNLISISEFLKK